MLKTITMLLQLLPLIISTVRSVEEAIPITGKGKEKADMVIKVIELAGEKVGELIPLVKNVIDIVVGTLNTVGVFKK